MAGAQSTLGWWEGVGGQEGQAGRGGFRSDGSRCRRLSPLPFRSTRTRERLPPRAASCRLIAEVALRVVNCPQMELIHVRLLPAGLSWRRILRSGGGGVFPILGKPFRLMSGCVWLEGSGGEGQLTSPFQPVTPFFFFTSNQRQTILDPKRTKAIINLIHFVTRVIMRNYSHWLVNTPFNGSAYKSQLNFVRIF